MNLFAPVIIGSLGAFFVLKMKFWCKSRGYIDASDSSGSESDT